MADAARPDRATVDQTPDPDEIDRAPAAERSSKMPSMPGTTMDPKKMIGFAAAAGAVMFTVLALGTGLTGNSTLPPVKPRPALEPAQYDPATVIAPTLAGAARKLQPVVFAVIPVHLCNLYCCVCGSQSRRTASGCRDACDRRHRYAARTLVPARSVMTMD